MNITPTRGAFLLIGIDADGDRRESTHASLEQATAVGRQCSKHDGNGPAWQQWEIWGNHPKTGEWSPLVCSVIARFKVGRIVATPSALAQLSSEDILIGVRRHQSGDWGDLQDDDLAGNASALVEGRRIMSLYTTANGKQFWIITEGDRSTTTIALPEDY